MINEGKAKISREVLSKALERLGELAVQSGLTLEVCLYGGALLMLAYDSREATKDVDAIVRSRDAGFKLASQVGREFQLPENWLNDDVKLFLAPHEQTCYLPQQFRGLHLTAPTAGYLLAMKALACRSVLPGYEGDQEDLKFLIRKMGIKSVGEIQAAIDRYYPDDVLPAHDRAVLTELIKEVWA
ncbi:MAG: hypothetical protein WD708_11820 [Kiritimatiellia bacterium]